MASWPCSGLCTFWLRSPAGNKTAPGGAHRQGSEHGPGRTAEIELVAKLAANIPRTWANYWKDSGEGQEAAACAANGRDTAVGRKTSAPAAGNGRKTAVGLSGTGRHREGGSRAIAGPEKESETQPHAWTGARSGGGAISGRADRAYTVGSVGARHG